MEHIRYHPIGEGQRKPSSFHAAVEQEEDGRRSAWVAAFPGCAVWGYSKEEAVEALQDAAHAYIEVLKENGREIPVAEGVQTLDTPAVAVSV